MKLTTVYKLIKLGFVPMKTNIVPRVSESVEAMEYSFLSEDGNKATHLLVSDTVVGEGICFIRLDKTCGRSDTEKFYHKIIETYVEENQVIGYVEDKLNITKSN